MNSIVLVIGKDPTIPKHPDRPPKLTIPILEPLPIKANTPRNRNIDPLMRITIIDVPMPHNFIIIKTCTYVEKMKLGSTLRDSKINKLFK
jgi:hypothetical protein